jgi:hypothetical protein
MIVVNVENDSGRIFSRAAYGSLDPLMPARARA